jgi:hypothetical protein
MAFIPVPNGIQLCFLFTTDSQKWQFCLTLQKSAGAPEDTDLQQAVADGSSWWLSFLKTALQGGTSLSEIVATDLTAQGAPQFRTTVNEAGTGAGTALPAGSCIVVSHRTAKRGRSYRGRSFLSGLSSSQQASPNKLLPATAAAIAGGFAALKVLLDGHGLDHVVASRAHNGAVTNPAEANEVINYVVDTAIDSQRRRLEGRGT